MQTLQNDRPKPLILQALEFRELTALEFPEDATPETIAAIEANWEAELETRFADIQERFTAIRKVIAREESLEGYHNVEIAALKAELKLREAGKAKHTRHIERVKKYASGCLEALQLPEVAAEGFVFKRQKNGGVLPLIVDESVLPEEYKKVIQAADNAKIRAGIDAGAEIRGVNYGEPTYRLTIKAL
jgi:hypothetical protein